MIIINIFLYPDNSSIEFDKINVATTGDISEVIFENTPLNDKNLFLVSTDEII